MNIQNDKQAIPTLSDQQHPRRTIGSIIWWVGVILSTLVVGPMVVIAYPLPFKIRFNISLWWTRFNLWSLEKTCKLTYVIEGAQFIPKTGCIVMAKHQSAWETFILQILLPPQSWILKKELLRIPFFGWALSSLEPIAIDRAAGRKAAQQVIDQGQRKLAQGRTVVIFPEGTRVAPGIRKRYRLGGFLLADATQSLIVPVAHNAGLFWPRQGVVKRAGTIHVVFGPPIATQGKTPQQVCAEVETWIETTSARLLQPYQDESATN